MEYTQKTSGFKHIKCTISTREKKPKNKTKTHTHRQQKRNESVVCKKSTKIVERMKRNERTMREIKE